MKNTDVINAWRKVIEGNNEFELIKCEEYGGTGFSKPGTSYDSICDNCSGNSKTLLKISKNITKKKMRLS